MTGQRFGFIRRCELHHQGKQPLSLELVDGLQNVLPAGLGWRFQLEYSTLGDGYKRTERLADSNLALFRLSSHPVDKAEPSEALRVNVAWSTGLEAATHLLSSAQLGAFRRGHALQSESDMRGRRGAYLLHTSLQLQPGDCRTWYIVADVALDAVAVTALQGVLTAGGDLAAALEADSEDGGRNLRRRIASADGLQATSDERATTRHLSNTLFNVMRGGIPVDGYRIARHDFQSFLTRSNTVVSARHQAFLATLPEVLERPELVARAAASGDPDLERLAREFLPLTFGRRHGDPSRPWNIFSIQVRHPDGTPIVAYQGNWRDIFQNWEALAFSYPGFLEGMIFKFLDASTADGYNPYRVLREGFEWETLDLHDPWSYIGYWGDHQVIYLLKLLEASERYTPGALSALLDRRLFTYADVPYRIKPYEAMLADPKNTIVFDHEAHAAAMARAGKLGADGKLLAGETGIVHATLAEKLLVVALAKLVNFIPGAGLWMNTQRPEWNDANNALVGHGVSVVTLCYLRRYLAFLQGLLAQAEGPVDLSAEIADLFDTVADILQAPPALQVQSKPDPDRQRLLDALGTAATAYREKIYARGFTGDRTRLALPRLWAFLEQALGHVDASIRANHRDDGLYHAYNLIQREATGLGIRRLDPMLEGQVAVLSAGILSPRESADLPDALRRSALRREDLGTYLLYPDRDLPHFLDKNILPEDAEARSGLLRAMLAKGDIRLVQRDGEGHLRFHAGFRNRTDLRAVLESLKASEYRALVEADEALVLDLYETVFDHQSFTGRSGTFYKYEGLGCVYWHMVSKLRLAVAEVRQSALGTDPAIMARIEAHHRDLLEGLGIHRSPSVYGAIPTDPYSHTPSFAGAQQPGMTGQVKEDFLTRFFDLGVQVQGGRLGFEPRLVLTREFLGAPRRFEWWDAGGGHQWVDLGPGSLAFTVCQVLVVITGKGSPQIRITREDGSERLVSGLRLERQDSDLIFQRRGDIHRLDVQLGLS
jgi:hypothetical protein